MARRRKGRFRRVKPDMGWWVQPAFGTASFSATGGGILISSSEILDFNDIDADSSLIAQDKSDWFIKRIIFNFFPHFRPDTVASLPAGAPARFYQLAIGTMENTEEIGALSTINPVIDATFYERWRRLLKTYIRPVYTPTLLAHGSNNGVLTSGTGPSYYTVPSEPWGAQHISDDFTVSNAGLVADSKLLFFISDSNGPGTTYDWLTDDALDWSAYSQVLLQKRRT